jgi:hypothetical protein
MPSEEEAETNDLGGYLFDESIFSHSCAEQ